MKCNRQAFGDEKRIVLESRELSINGLAFFQCSVTQIWHFFKGILCVRGISLSDRVRALDWIDPDDFVTPF